MAFLEQRTTNPLVMAMDAENIKTKATFQKWTTIYNRIFFNFLLLEAHATGLSIGTEENKEKLLVARQTVANSIATWREEYEKDEAYFKEVSEWWAKEFMSTSDKTNAERADEIVKKLESYLTHDSFYVFVFNKCKWQEDYTHRCNNESDQILGNRGSGGCEALIYRSKTGNQKSEDSYTEIKNQVDSCVSGKLTYNGTLEGVIKNQLLNTNILSENNYTAMIRKDMNPEIRSANCPGHEWGPGWWRQVEVNDTRKSDVRTFYLISSFE
ncbi:hypothetical protein CAEBREN_17372 [Caenorhabditis brenneri]|uniref:Uncharacterized protein n=1 Tax=Caenorhabditis brenneri TaxID=135651 RepID=G0NXG8_CAEBE|nr:hypothetical protein CAEBREN_17372 [Caenorhabditis brenneri]